MQKKLFVIIGTGKGLGNAIAREFGSHDFRVVLIARNAEHLAEYKKEMEAEGRFGRPEEAANVIVFLASDAASYVTGCSYGVTGGMGA